MNEKQQQLTFDKGITNVPSDLLCSDNALEECEGLVYDNGEHIVIQKPKLLIDNTTSGQGSIPTILYIHKFAGSERFIGYNQYNQIVWGVRSGNLLANIRELGVAYTGEQKITSVGKTLVVSSQTNPLRYFTWKNDNTYSEGIITLPTIQLRADLLYKGEITNSANIGDLFGENKFHIPVIDIHQQEYNDVVIGLYAQNNKEIEHKRCFSKPFFVCAALELFDGTYTMMTQPILMPVALTNNVYASLWMYKAGEGEYTYSRSIKLHTGYAELSIQQDTDYSEYSDIVKDVVIFVTRGIDLYDTGGDQSITRISEGGILVNGINNSQVFSTLNPATSDLPQQEHNFNVINKRLSNDFNDDITGASIFYRICSIGTSPREMYPVTSLMNSWVLENLESQEILTGADFFTNNSLYAEMIYSYNSRLNISGVKRGIFRGFSYFMPYGKTMVNCTIKVEIETDIGSKVAILKNVEISDKTGWWFFYPDARAKKVVITNGDNVLFAHELKEHPGLNGAYCFLGLPVQNGQAPRSDETTITKNDQSPEMLTSYILTSDADNPYVFRAEGYYRVGTGRVYAMSTTTQAISQGQFGQYPLLVFTDEGIWALSVANTGFYSAIHPMSREVCINTKSITQTDGAVFFVSRKGLMVIVGNDVKCVSEQLSGKLNDNNATKDIGNFKKFLENCFIAYDYRDSALYLFDGIRRTIDGVVVFGSKYCYVFSIKNGSFSTFKHEERVIAAANNYPDTIIQYHDKVIYTLYNREDRNLDGETIDGKFVPNKYNACLITRPMKLENGLALKSLMQVRHIKQMQGDMTLRIFASNNTEHWVELHSLRGTPWKYYRFRYDFTSLAATDRFAGSVVITQERRTEKLL